MRIVRFQNPLMLPCLHSFCSHCLENLEVKAGKQSLPCPTCRRNVSLPETGVKGLPRNSWLTSMMERQDLVEKLTKEKSQNCDFCKNTTRVIQFCTECQLRICSVCQGGHSRLPGASDHVMIAAHEVSNVNDIKGVMKKEPPCCPLHLEKKLGFYCKTCSGLICPDCNKQMHQGHVVCEVEQEAGSIKSSLEWWHKEAQLLVQNAKQSCKKMNNVSESIKTHTSSLKQEIKDQCKKYINTLESQTNALLQEVEQMKDEKMNKINKRLLLMRRCIEEIDHIQGNIHQILEENNQWQIAAHVKDLIKSINTLKQVQIASVQESDKMEGEARVFTSMKFVKTTGLQAYCINSSSEIVPSSCFLGNLIRDFAESELGRATSVQTPPAISSCSNPTSQPVFVQESQSMPGLPAINYPNQTPAMATAQHPPQKQLSFQDILQGKI